MPLKEKDDPNPRHSVTVAKNIVKNCSKNYFKKESHIIKDCGERP